MRGLALAAAFLPSIALAEGGLSLSRTPAVVGDPAIVVPSPEVRGHRMLRLGVVADFAYEPLVVIDPRQEPDRVVQEQAWMHLLGAYTFRHRWLVALDVPMMLRASGDARSAPEGEMVRPDGGIALGDVGVTGRGRLVGPAGDGTKGSLELTVWLPTGSAAHYAGDDGVGARGAWLVGGTSGRFRWSAEAGMAHRPERRLPAILPHRIGSALVLGAGAFFVLDAPKALQAGVELMASSGVFGGARLLDARSTGAELLTSVRVRPASGAVQVGVGAGPGIGQLPGTPDYRILALALWSPEREPPPPDRDEDGVPDTTDVCPDLPGVASGDSAMNGCPEVPRDADGDAIPDAFDACPGEAGDPTGDRRTHGCARLADSDGDRIPDKIDACPGERGVASSDSRRHGCPPPPPPPPKATLEAERIAIAEQVQFETGTAVLRPESEPLLGAVARILVDHPEVERVETRGHTDDTGTEELNLELSRARAASVVEWLVTHGVERSRLEPQGFGSSRPIGDNRTEEGRTRNRRVEFVIVKTRTAGASPAPGGHP